MSDLSMKMIYFKRKLKMTNETIAEKTGLPVGTISRIASGQTKNPTLKTLRKIAKVFDCSVDDLQGEGTVEPYYLDNETAELAQELHDNPEYKCMLKASRGLDDEDLKFVTDFIMKIKNSKKG